MLFVTEQPFDMRVRVCVHLYPKEWEMIKWHFLVSCKLSLIITCRSFIFWLISVSPVHSSSKPPVRVPEQSRTHLPSVKIGENGCDGSLVMKHSRTPVTKRSPLSTCALVFSKESEAMSRWRRNFTLLFFELNSLIYSRNKQMRLITSVTPWPYITSQICGICKDL